MIIQRIKRRRFFRGIFFHFCFREDFSGSVCGSSSGVSCSSLSMTSDMITSPSSVDIAMTSSDGASFACNPRNAWFAECTIYASTVHQRIQQQNGYSFKRSFLFTGLHRASKSPLKKPLSMLGKRFFRAAVKQPCAWQWPADTSAPPLPAPAPSHRSACQGSACLSRLPPAQSASAD